MPNGIKIKAFKDIWKKKLSFIQIFIYLQIIIIILNCLTLTSFLSDIALLYPVSFPLFYIFQKGVWMFFYE